MSIEQVGKEQQAHEIIDAVLSAINLYWDYLLVPPQNSLHITARDGQDGGRIIQETTTIQRFYDTAYFIKCQRSDLESLGSGSPVFNTPLDTTEYRILPTLLEKGVVNLRHTNADGVTINMDVQIDKLQGDDPLALILLEHLQLNLIALLIGHCKEATFFDPLPTQVKLLLEATYGKETAPQLWSAGMSDHDASPD